MNIEKKDLTQNKQHPLDGYGPNRLLMAIKIKYYNALMTGLWRVAVIFAFLIKKFDYVCGYYSAYNASY